LNVFSVKLSGSTGSIAWGPTLYGSDLLFLPQYFFQALDGAGNAVVLTESWSLAPPIPPFTVYTPDFLTLKINGVSGALAWGPNVYGGPNSAVDIVSSLAIDASADVIVAGSSGGAAAVLKYSGTTGATLWGPVLQANASHPAVATDASGNVFMSVASGTGNATDIETFKYDAASGTPLWGPVVYDSGGAGAAGGRLC